MRVGGQKVGFGMRPSPGNPTTAPGPTYTSPPRMWVRQWKWGIPPHSRIHYRCHGRSHGFCSTLDIFICIQHPCCLVLWQLAIYTLTPRHPTHTADKDGIMWLRARRQRFVAPSPAKSFARVQEWVMRLEPVSNIYNSEIYPQIIHTYRHTTWQ